jgi:hypothetical protein
MAVADHLAVHGGEVLIVGAQPTLAPEVGRRAKMLPLGRLETNPSVRILLRSEIRAIRGDQILVSGPSGQAWLPAPGPVLVSHGVEPGRHLPSLGVHLAGEAAGAGSSMRAALASARSVVDELLPRLC